MIVIKLGVVVRPDIERSRGVDFDLEDHLALER